MNEMKKLFNKKEIVAVSLDMQGSLMSAVHNGEFMKQRAIKFFKSLGVLDVPILVTQQYTKGLGMTDEDVKAAIKDFSYIDKTSFSCVKNSEFMQAIKSTGRKRVVLTGMETHICVLQTAMDLLDEGYEVYIVEDCTSSRAKIDKKVAIERMFSEGVKVATYESILFECLGGAGSDEFKQISKIIK